MWIQIRTNYSELPGYVNIKVRKVLKIWIRYNQVPHLTHYTTWESVKKTIKHHEREPLNFASDHIFYLEAANRHTPMA